jgi:hypothetical protein
MLAALEFGFCEFHLERVAQLAFEAKTGSRRAREKLGMLQGSDFDRPSIPR